MTPERPSLLRSACNNVEVGRRRRAIDKKLKAVASLRISFHQEIGNESLQESADETDHQYHLPSQAAAGKIGIPDCEGRMPEASSKSRTPAEITPIRRRNVPSVKLSNNSVSKATVLPRIADAIENAAPTKPPFPASQRLLEASGNGCNQLTRNSRPIRIAATP